MTHRATRTNHPISTRSRPNGPVGLYDPAFEHDSCGVALVARLNGVPAHETLERALAALANLEHRGAAGADPLSGDGAGVLMQLPDEFFRREIGADLPAPGAYGVAVCFLPRDEPRRHELEAILTDAVEQEGQQVVCWRDVPMELDEIGETARAAAPVVRQLVVAASPALADDPGAFERKLYVIRRLAEIAAGRELVIPSFSARTLVYKGMLMSPQLAGCYPDLRDPQMKSALALVHSRFSTNTFPSWELAHPYRMVAHNGEINTVRGNVNWMRARESQLQSELFGDDIAKVLPVVRPGGSDTANFDNVLELLVLAGRSLPHALMMMIPEAYAGRSDLPEELRGFYAFHSCLTEPWDGPASISFTDGTVIGATLDRNGLRPGRWRRRRTAGSCSPRRPACSTSHPRTCCARDACSLASSSSSTSLRDGSSPTTRSRRRSPRSSPMASGSAAASFNSPTCPSAHHECRGASRSGPGSSPSATPRRT